jgi:hypothetical protein
VLTPVILTTQEQRSEGSWFKASPGKYFMRLYLKKLGLAEWLEVKALSSSPSTAKNHNVLSILYYY